MKTSIGLFFKLFILSLFLISIFLLIEGSKEKKDMKENNKETAIFNINPSKNEIISLKKDIKEYLKLKFVSVTTDQPIYWLSEEVFLKVLMPANPNKEIEIFLQKKDATPKNIGRFKLNESGILVKSIMSGKSKKLEPGEYRVDVKTIDNKLTSYTTFSVVEGSLGALSFAYEFEQITTPKQLEKVKGAWFLGNASGIGKRWGNGLNVKNEIRYLNQPYTGNAIIKSRCYLPGCNGVEAGPPQNKFIKDGSLEVVLDVSSHSGPFEIEVITDKGSIKKLFAQSGHVERETIIVSKNMSNVFHATLAPYENTTPVYGRNIYISKESENKDDVFEIKSVIADPNNEIEIKIKKDIKNPKLFVLYPMKNKEFKTEEVELNSNIEKDKILKIKCFSPYSFIGIGGFVNKDFKEGWALIFTQSPMDIEIKSSDMGIPLKNFDIEIKTINKETKKGISVYGILEVFDNRVQSKSCKEPLVSAIGDSVREFSNYLTSWQDMTGITSGDEYSKEETCVPSNGISKDKKVYPAPMYKTKMLKTAAKPRNGGDKSPLHEDTSKEPEEEQETIREGEKKVVFCDVVKTDNNGIAKVNITLPPQTGRCKIRFVAIENYDYLEKIKDIDIKKGSYLELNIPNLIIPDAQVLGKISVINTTKDKLKLNITGAGVLKEINFDIKPSETELQTVDIDFQVIGKNYGKMKLQLINSSGKVLDKREVEIKNISTYPINFSDIKISDGNPITIQKGRKIAIYSNPAKLLQGITMNIVTTMYSWFGHSEAISSSAVIRSILLRAIQDNIINDEGLRDTLKSDLVKSVKDLYEAFYDKDKNLFRPYPDIETNELWSLWTVKNLSKMIHYLNNSDVLKDEFSETIKLASLMVENVYTELKKNNPRIDEKALYDFEKNVDLIPVEINGKVIYQAQTDPAVINWFINKMLPVLDISSVKDIKNINKNFIKAYDTYRFLRSFERTGAIYYLLENAKGLYKSGDKNFTQVFNTISRGVILTQEPGIIQGPAMLGGVYSSPLTIMSFLDLLLEMSEDKKFLVKEVEIDGKKEVLSDSPMILESKDKMTIKSNEYTVIRIDDQKDINMYEYIKDKTFFNIKTEKQNLKVGEETEIIIELDKDKDPTEYYALIAIPSVLSVKQTEDLLSDYKGQLIYGQRASGGVKIQLLTVPFRGSRNIVLRTDANYKGVSEGFVMVKHINNPDIIVTSKIKQVTVK